MAIDTYEKKLSLLDGDTATTPGIPLPNTIGVPEKLHFLWLYSGLLDTTPDVTWPLADLKPRHLGIYPCANPIGGGVALVGREPVIDSGAGYWRIVLGGFYIKTRAQALLWRALEAEIEGRGRSVLVPFFDGKRAPWPSTPGGSLTALADAEAVEGATSIAIDATGLADLEAGMHFSAGNWGYRIKSIASHVGNIYTCTIWPKVREDIADGSSLEFGRPVVRMRLENDRGMSLPLHLLKSGAATVAFVEDVP